MDYYGKVCAKHPEQNGVRNKNGTCKQCNRESAKRSWENNKDKEEYKLRSKQWVVDNKEKRKSILHKYYVANRDAELARGRASYKANIEDIKQRKRRWHTENSKVINERSRVWRLANTERAKQQAAQWQKENAALVNAKTARRRAKILQATPAWADDFILGEAYELAQLRTKATGVVHHVDHVVPLQGRIVCGLHCEFNLQVIPGRENKIKNNVRWPDMP